MKTLYMADIDGTLLNSKGVLSDYTAKTLNALIERGLPFTVNTSRSPESAMSVIEKLNLKLPAILMNGSMFYNTKEKKAEHLNCISPVAARTAVAVCKRLNAEPFVFSYINGGIDVQYASCNSPASAAFLKARGSYYRSCREAFGINASGSIPFIICVGEGEHLNRVAEELKRIKDISASVYLDNSGGYSFLEIYSQCAGKGKGALAFKEKYGFGRIVAFGDNFNDIPMFEAADFSIAVANAYPEIKNIASLEIDSCDSDAVANYLLLEWARNPELY